MTLYFYHLSVDESTVAGPGTWPVTLSGVSSTSGTVNAINLNTVHAKRKMTSNGLNIFIQEINAYTFKLLLAGTYRISYFMYSGQTG